MKPHAGFWLATLGINAAWLLAVLGRDRVNAVLLAGAVLALIFTPAHRRRWALLAALTGILMDSLWNYTGVLHFSGHSLLPLWMVALWLAFGCWWFWLLDLIKSAPLPLAVLGSIAGPLAGIIGWKLGAIQPGTAPEIMLLLLSVGWAIFLPAVSWPRLNKPAP